MPTESTHEKIARRAHELWQVAGCPEGTHDEHWFAAERELSAAAGKTDAHAHSAKPHAGESDANETGSATPPPAVAHQQSIQDELQKQAARAPQTPTTHAPKTKPAPPGKPVWSKPHSS